MDEYRKSNGLIGIIVVVVILVGIGFGCFYLLQNKEELNVNLPWEDNTQKNNKKNDKEDSVDESLKQGRIDVKNQTPCQMVRVVLAANNLQQDDKGYTFDVYSYVDRKGASTEIEFFKVLVDNYETSTFEEVHVSAYETEKTTLRILKTDLDAQEIERFSKISVYLKATQTTDEKTETKECLLSIPVHHQIAVNNNKKNLQQIDEKDNTSISYYDIQEDKDYHYIRFLLYNKRSVSPSTIYIKKLVINDKIYSLPDFKESAYKGARKAFYLKIPKKDFKKIDKFTISFFIEVDPPEERTIYRTDQSYYITNEFTKTFDNS